jgi:hypothetical protein
VKHAASSDQLGALLVLRPRTPRHLDGEMLRYANSLGVDTWDDEAAKSAVRGAFWRAVAEHRQESGSLVGHNAYDRVIEAAEDVVDRRELKACRDEDYLP